MPKMKSHKGLKKKVRVTKNGKLIRNKAGKSHLNTGKNATRRRNLRKKSVSTGAAARKAKVLT